MPRTPRLAPQALAIVAVVAAGWLAACQDYNFSPVRYCLIQPGTERVTLSDISTADLLFVVDDSGSMGGEQQKLSASFDAFVANLQATNADRVAVKLEPIDFHIAITTTSVFLNAQTTATCSTSCGGAVGQQVCCDSVSSRPLQEPRDCASAADCNPGNQCLETCAQRSGEKTCCAGPGAQPEQVPVTCQDVGAACGRLQDRYVVTRAPRLCETSGGVTTSCTVGPDGTGGNPAPAGYSCKTTCNGLGGTSACCDANGNVWSDPTCDIGVGVEGGLYPRGDFVRKGSNPRVLHFDKGLFCDRATDSTGKEVCACTLSADPLACDTPGGNAEAITTLVGQFKQNVAVGTCGSGQEQGMEAARRAIQKALDGTQKPEAGGAQPEWPHPRRVVAAGERPPSKLVVVYVGDEDDCSTAEDVTRGVIFTSSGNDACEADGNLPPEQQKRTALGAYAEYLASLGRPLAGAFIVSATGAAPCTTAAECQALCGASTCPANCVDADCGASLCCDAQCTGNVNVCTLAGQCGGQGAGFRFLEFADTLAGPVKADTVVGSVCNPGEGYTPPPIQPPPPAPPAGSYQKPGFSTILDRVAEVVKQPAGLQLPTQPATAQLTLLRIALPDGTTRKTCVGPAPAGTTGAALDGYDWWFTGGDDTDRTPTGPSKFVFLNRTTRNCEANPGETYSADYLGLMPPEGCLTQADCQAALGRTLEDWSCDLSQGGARGTCLCAAP